MPVNRRRREPRFSRLFDTFQLLPYSTLPPMSSPNTLSGRTVVRHIEVNSINTECVIIASMNVTRVNRFLLKTSVPRTDILETTRCDRTCEVKIWTDEDQLFVTTKPMHYMIYLSILNEYSHPSHPPPPVFITHAIPSYSGTFILHNSTPRHSDKTPHPPYH